MEFVCALQQASLDDKVGLTGEDLECLRNPPQTPCLIDNPCDELAISMFLALQHASEAAYSNIQAAVKKCYPDSEVPSLHLEVGKVRLLGAYEAHLVAPGPEGGESHQVENLRDPPEK
ncbi:hypothetical protein C8R48DRAFT_779767 [Suillus tomentosus]|nr:hypothetical protein C8R48DRAFT_779767 [Suillus tomentosus]